MRKHKIIYMAHCPKCSAMRRVNANGVVYRHKRDSFRHEPMRKCDGSGMTVNQSDIHVLDGIEYRGLQNGR